MNRIQKMWIKQPSNCPNLLRNSKVFSKITSPRVFAFFLNMTINSHLDILVTVRYLSSLAGAEELQLLFPSLAFWDLKNRSRDLF